MAVKIIINLQAQPGKGDALVQFFGEVLGDTRAFAGCIECDVFRNQDDSDQLSIVELFESRAAYDKYFAWRVESGTIDAIGALIAATPAPQFYDKVDA